MLLERLSLSIKEEEEEKCLHSQQVLHTVLLIFLPE